MSDVHDRYARWIDEHTAPVPLFDRSGSYVGDLSVSAGELRQPDGTTIRVRTSGACIVNEYGIPIASPRGGW